jgi:hypothetical protein
LGYRRNTGIDSYLFKNATDTHRFTQIKTKTIFYHKAHRASKKKFFRAGHAESAEEKRRDRRGKQEPPLINADNVDYTDVADLHD